MSFGKRGRLADLIFLLILIHAGASLEATEDSSQSHHYRPVAYESLPFDLNNVQKLQQAELPDSAGRLLAKNGFVVAGKTLGSMPDVYKTGRALPPLITLDSVYEVFLSEVELAWGNLQEKQAAKLFQFQEAMWDSLLQNAERIPVDAAPSARQVLLMLAVGRRLQDPTWQFPQKLPFGESLAGFSRLVAREVEQTTNANGSSMSVAWGQPIDWSHFKPIGPDAESESRRRNFRVMQWWSRTKLLLDSRAEGRRRRTVASVLTWIMIIASDSETRKDPGPKSLLDDLESVYSGFLGADTDGIGLNDRDYLEIFEDLATELPQGIGSDDLDKHLILSLSKLSTKQEKPVELVVLPARKDLGNFVFDKTTGQRRLLPRALDLLSASGNEQATEIVLKMASPDSRPTLKVQLESLQETIAEVDERLWAGGLGMNARLRHYCLALANPRDDERLPLFCRTSAYRTRSLEGALASWMAVREIYAGRLAVPFRVGGSSEPPPGLVEPNLDAWQRLIELTVATAEMFGAEEVTMKSGALGLALRFRRLAEKQIRGERLTRGERRQFLYYHVTLSNLIQDKRQPLRGADRRAAVVIGKGIIPGSPTNVATTRFAGKACRAMYAIVEYQGKLHLLRGGVFTYHEFDKSGLTSMDRKEFRALMDSADAPGQLKFSQSYAVP